MLIIGFQCFQAALWGKDLLTQFLPQLRLFTFPIKKKVRVVRLLDVATKVWAPPHAPNQSKACLPSLGGSWPGWEEPPTSFFHLSTNLLFAQLSLLSAQFAQVLCLSVRPYPSESGGVGPHPAGSSVDRHAAAMCPGPQPRRLSQKIISAGGRSRLQRKQLNWLC